MHRASWILFVVIATLGTLMGVRSLFDPRSLLAIFDMMGVSTAVLAAPEHDALVDLMGRWVATALLGGNVLTIVIACTALRRGERWAAWSMLYWPLMFVSHFLMYPPGPMRTMQIAWTILSVAALFVLIARPRATARVATAAAAPG